MAGTTNFYGISYPTSTDYVKDGAVAIQTVATGFDSAVAIPTYNAQTGATYTFVLSDTGKTVTASNASASTYTIPPTSSVAWTANTTLEVTNLGAGVVTFAAGAGVTVTNTAQTLAQYQSAALIRTGLNAWTVTPTSGGSSGMTLINATSFSAVSSQSLNNVFTSTYQNYEIRLNITAKSVLGAINFRYRTSGTDNSTANYQQAAIYLRTNNANAGDGAVGATQISSFGTSNGIATSVIAQVFNPQIASVTHTTHQFWGGDAATEFIYLGGSLFNATTAFDGFTLTAASGTITGTVYVYGLAK